MGLRDWIVGTERGRLKISASRASVCWLRAERAGEKGKHHVGWAWFPSAWLLGSIIHS